MLLLLNPIKHLESTLHALGRRTDFKAQIVFEPCKNCSQDSPAYTESHEQVYCSDA